MGLRFKRQDKTLNHRRHGRALGELQERSLRPNSFSQIDAVLKICFHAAEEMHPALSLLNALRNSFFVWRSFRLRDFEQDPSLANQWCLGDVHPVSNGVSLSSSQSGESIDRK